MEQIEDINENLDISKNCICTTCFSRPIAAGEGMYCIKSPSNHLIEKRGCNCPDCLVWEKYRFSIMYYCDDPGK